MKKPSEEIREIYQKRKQAAEEKEFDEIDMLFGSCSVVEKSIIEFLDQRFENQIKTIQKSYAQKNGI